MISHVGVFSDEVKSFLNAEKIPADNMPDEFGKTFWIICSKNESDEIVGVLCYSFMYSTWTRYNPFISTCRGQDQKKMVQYLAGNFPGVPIRGCVNEGDDDTM